MKITQKQVTGLIERLKTIEAELRGIQTSRLAGEETVPVINGVATCAKLKFGMRYHISTEGLKQPIELIIRQENNILYLSTSSIQSLTVNYF